MAPPEALQEPLDPGSFLLCLPQADCTSVGFALNAVFASYCLLKRTERTWSVLVLIFWYLQPCSYLHQIKANKRLSGISFILECSVTQRSGEWVFLPSTGTGTLTPWVIAVCYSFCLHAVLVLAGPGIALFLRARWNSAL